MKATQVTDLRMCGFSTFFSLLIREHREKLTSYFVIRSKEYKSNF